jgi:dynein heavy chain
MEFIFIQIVNSRKTYFRFIQSWIDTRDSGERTNLMILFEKYIPTLLDVTKMKFKKITPIPEICHLEMLCNLLDCFLTKENVPNECPKEWYIKHFSFNAYY